MVIVAAIAALDDGVEPHRRADRAAAALARRNAGLGRRAPPAAGDAADLHRRHPAARLPLLPPDGRVRGAGRDRPDRLRRRRAVPARACWAACSGAAPRRAGALGRPGGGVRCSGPTRCSCRAFGGGFFLGAAGARARALGHRGAAPAGAARARRHRSAGARAGLEPRRQHAAVPRRLGLFARRARSSGCRARCSSTCSARPAASRRASSRSRRPPRTCSCWPSASSAPTRRARSSTAWRASRAGPGACRCRPTRVIARLERELSGSVGAASAHAMVAADRRRRDASASPS